jgi:aspartate kinase
MLTIKKYKRPITGISIEGEKVRMTPGLLAKFSKPLADSSVNIYAISEGEYSFSFFVDEAETEKVTLALGDLIAKSAYEGMSIRRNMGMLSITGPELTNAPGMLKKILDPIAKEKINILQMTSSYDSILFFFDYKALEKAFTVMNRNISGKTRKAKKK